MLAIAAGISTLLGFGLSAVGFATASAKSWPSTIGCAATERSAVQKANGSSSYSLETKDKLNYIKAREDYATSLDDEPSLKFVTLSRESVSVDFN